VTDSSSTSLEALIASGEVTLDSQRRCAFRSGQSIALTDKEHDVLWMLIAGVESMQRGLDEVQDDVQDPFNTTMRVTLMSLQRKLNGPSGDEGSAGVREPVGPRPRPSAGAARRSEPRPDRDTAF
jgi:DNA-binding response OmpR family regulator